MGYTAVRDLSKFCLIKPLVNHTSIGGQNKHIREKIEFLKTMMQLYISRTKHGT